MALFLNMKKLLNIALKCSSIDDLKKIKQDYKQDQKIEFQCEECKSKSIRRICKLKFKLICSTCSQKITSLEKYGVPFPNMSKDVQAKVRQTNLKKYGFEYSSQSPQIKEKKKQHSLEKWGSISYFQTDEFKRKAIQKHLKKYGVKNVSQSQEIKDKKIATSLKNFGVSHPTQSQTVKDRIKKTNLEKYGVSEYFKSLHFKLITQKTSLEKYGVYSPNQSNYVKEIQAQSNIEKYGFPKATMSPVIKCKAKQTNIQKYKVDNFCKSLEYKNRQKDIISKRDETTLARYGVRNFSQTKEAAQFRHARYNYKGHLFDSSWELAYFIYLTDHNIEFEYQPSTPLVYCVLNREHFYFPDFKIKDQYVEIKGDQFFEKGTRKFINPFNRSPEEDFKNECKYKCMLENNVKVLTDISEQIRYVKEKYGADFFKKHKTLC